MNASTDDLTKGSIYRHLIRLSIPASMGMVFNTLYNLTDLWFAGMLSDAALAGMSVAGSVFFLLVGMGAGLQTGTAAMIASDIGAGRRNEAQAWLDTGFGVAIVVSALSLGIGWWIADEVIAFLGATPETAPLAKEYLTVTLIGNIAFVLGFVASGALMAMGDTKSNRNALAVGFFANFALNPALTFGLGLGVTGLALATVIIKICAAVYLFSVLKRRLGAWAMPRFDVARWGPFLRQTVPASLNMMTIILGGFITIAFVGQFGVEQVAGYTVGLRLEQVLLLPALGLNAAVMALAGQNFGAGQPARVRESYLKGLTVGLGMAAVCIPVMVFLSPALMSIFSGDETIIGTGATYLRIDALAFYGYVVLFQSMAVLQAMKRPMFPMALGLARQLVLPACINYVLIVWLGYPLMAVFVTVVGVVIAAACIGHWYTMRILNA